MFNKILVATGRAEYFDAPVLTAIQLAKQFDSELYILHVLESNKRKDWHFVKHFKTGKDIFYSNDYVQTVGMQIQKRCAAKMGPNLKYKIKVIPGSPCEEILAWAEKECVDMILMGPHTAPDREPGGIDLKGTIGSTAQGVIMHELYPVMIVNSALPEEKLKFKRIMVGIDFSETCSAALLFAADMARKYEAKLFVFYMAPACPCPQGSRTDYKGIANIMQQRFDELCSIIPEGTEYKFEVREGIKPHIEILKYAGQNNIDLIVLGTHTEETNERWYVGSAVEGVSCKTDSPVIVITNYES